MSQSLFKQGRFQDLTYQEKNVKWSKQVSQSLFKQGRFQGDLNTYSMLSLLNQLGRNPFLSRAGFKRYLKARRLRNFLKKELSQSLFKQGRFQVLQTRTYFKSMIFLSQSLFKQGRFQVFSPFTRRYIVYSCRNPFLSRAGFK